MKKILVTGAILFLFASPVASFAAVKKSIPLTVSQTNNYVYLYGLLEKQIDIGISLADDRIKDLDQLSKLLPADNAYSTIIANAYSSEKSTVQSYKDYFTNAKNITESIISDIKAGKGTAKDYSKSLDTGNKYVGASISNFSSYMDKRDAMYKTMLDIAKKPTAMCKDMTLSYSASRSGTCSSHGGVYFWY